jgi:hypothetical protein
MKRLWDRFWDLLWTVTPYVWGVLLVLLITVCGLFICGVVVWGAVNVWRMIL